MSETMSLALSDGLFRLRRHIRENGACGITMDAEQAESLQKCLKELGMLARTLENEVSRHRWNEAARGDRRREEQRVLAELSRPETNLIQFPVIPRPFSDGRSPGGVA